MLCGWKAGGGESRRRGREEEEGRAGAGAWGVGCPSARGERGRRRRRRMLQPRVCGRGRGRASWGARLAARLDLEGAGSAGAPHPGGRQKGRRRPFLLSERSRVGWPRRSPPSLSLPPHFFVGVPSPLSPHRVWGHFPRGWSCSTPSLSISFSSPTRYGVAAGGRLRNFVDIDKSP